MDRTAPVDSNACGVAACGGTGDALQITVGAALLAGLVVAKLYHR